MDDQLIVLGMVSGIWSLHTFQPADRACFLRTLSREGTHKWDSKV